MQKIKSLLLVEDDEIFALLLSRALTESGFKVSIAKNISEADEFIRLTLFTHAVLDLKLEHETTLDLIPTLCAKNPDTNILMLTGYASIATAVEAVKRGATNYLQKPADINVILTSLHGEEKKQAEQTDTAGDTLSVQRMEWEHIQTVLVRNDGNISATARELNMHRRTLQRKLYKKPVKK